MKSILTLVAFITLLSTQYSYSCTEDGSSGIVEDNDLYISVDDKNANPEMTEEIFNQVIDKIGQIYEPIVREEGGRLRIDKKWSDGTVNAYAQRQGSTFLVTMFGGLARHETITADGLALVVCHEIGHHIGGAPKKGGVFGVSWASNEGQSDYFATTKCLRKMFETEDNEAILKEMNIPQFAKDACQAQFSEELDYLICLRGAMAGASVANLFSALRRIDPPQFDTPDARRSATTDHNHPQPQCRMDTYFQGALCQIDHREPVSQRDEAKGYCYRANGDTTGVRPLCWFKPSQE
jgi:hypothetical protein